MDKQHLRNLQLGTLSQRVLAATDSYSKRRLEGIDSIVASVVEVVVLDVQGLKNNGQPLRIFELDIVLMNALVVNDVEQTRELVYVDIEAEHELNVLLDVMAYNHDLARPAIGILRGQDLGTDPFDAVEAHDLGLSAAVLARTGGRVQGGIEVTYPNWK